LPKRETLLEAEMDDEGQFEVFLPPVSLDVPESISARALWKMKFKLDARREKFEISIKWN
jgi:Flp pilus assembly CpaF family ATPase